MPLTLVLQVVGGAALGFAFLWLFVLVCTRLNDRRTERAVSALRAQMEINAIRRRTVRRLFDVANGRDDLVRPMRNRRHFLDRGEDEP